MVDENEIRDVVKSVLTQFLKTEEKTAPKIQVKTEDRVEDRRKSAKENIARWLGQTESRLPAKSETQTKIQHGPTKNLVPQPKNKALLEEMLKHTPARVGVWRAGTRYLTKVALKLRADHAIAKDAVYAELKDGYAESQGWIPLHTKAKNKEEFLLRPDLGRQLSDESLKVVEAKGTKNCDVQIIVADGLSAWAAERYAVPMVKDLVRLCAEKNYSVGTIFCVKYSRIAVQDVIGETLNAKVSMILLGERPGLGTGDSLSNYMVYGPKIGMYNARKSMISNIHPQGHTPEEAARLTVFMIGKMFEQKTSGVDLKV